MASDALRALLYPFAKAILTPAGPTFFMRAEPSSDLAPFMSVGLTCEQTSKRDHDRLVAEGITATRSLSGRFAVGLCLLTKFKQENFYNIARAWTLLEPGGLLVCAGARDTGAASVERHVQNVLGTVESVSKFHQRVFWVRRSQDEVLPEGLADWLEGGRLQRVSQTGLLSRPGVYGWAKIDEGSQLLVDHLPVDLSGRVADFGAGSGYLSLEALERRGGITAIDLFENEWVALEAARANFEERLSGAAATYHWCDVTGRMPEACYDWVIMNPPFHEGKDGDPEIGRAFVRAAARALVPGGRLLMVANRHLPYETEVAARFAHAATVVETARFKVVLARVG